MANNNEENLKILALGGPDDDAPPLFEEGLDLTGKDRPQVLIIPTPKNTPKEHLKFTTGVQDFIASNWGLPTRVLHNFDAMPPAGTVDEMLDWADLVYISGGNTKLMMDIWQRYGIDAKLRMHVLGGLVLTGLSAGAIAPFKWGHTNTQKYDAKVDTWDYQLDETLGLISAAANPHNNISRKFGDTHEESFKKMFAKEAAAQGTPVGFAIDDFAGIKIYDGQIEFKSAKKGAGTTLLDIRTGEVLSSRLDSNRPIPLQELGL